MIDIKKNLYEEETHIMSNEDEKCMIEVPKGTFKISTEDEEPETGLQYIEIHETTYRLPLHYKEIDYRDIIQTINELSNQMKLLRIENEEIKQKLNEINIESEIIDVVGMPDRKIEKLIIKYLKNHRGEEIYPSDIAFTYNLGARKVFDMCKKLKDEGKIA